MSDQAQALQCSHCNHSNPLGSLQCHVCHNPLPTDDQTLTGAITTPVGLAATTPGPMKTTAGTTNWSGANPAAFDTPVSFEPGSIIAGRYEIQGMLGEGGMGAVYKALDRELDRTVALKVIRPELAGSSEILSRFKQEIILARQITHRNVIRIYDLGAAGHVRFITMEFVEGEDLSKLGKKRRFSTAEAIEIARQVCGALEAAHAESVIHRDLKPHNIMVGANGKVSVMDFGLARTFESNGMTQAGLVLGTPAYMSPEQAQGTASDHRSDIFALGIVFYELLTGVTPFKAENTLATLLKRTQGPPPAPSTLNPAVTPEIDAVVFKALATRPEDRYQTAKDFRADLDVLAGASASWSSASALPMPAASAAPTASRTWMYAAAGLALVLVIASLAWWRTRTATPRPAGKPVSVLVADFDNTTGDSVFSGSLEPMVGLALEGASFVNVIRRDQAMRIAKQIDSNATGLNEKLARLVALREGIDVVLAGSIKKAGDYRVQVQALDGANGKEIAKSNASASDKQGVGGTAGKLAAPIRRALGDRTSESQQVAAAETFTSASLDAVKSYAEAQDLRFSGKGEQSVPVYLKAISQDPNFGSAYASLAAVYANLGQREEASKYFRLAMERIDRMTEREKYRTRGGYYLASLDAQKAIEEFTALVKQYPADNMGHASLAYAYYLKRDMPRAMEEQQRAVEIYPKYVPYRNNLALYALYAGQFEMAAKEASTVLQRQPSYLKGYTTLALAELAQGQSDKAREAYGKLAGVSALGASASAAGLADMALYERRPTAAIEILEPAVASDLEKGLKSNAAKKLAMLAEAQFALKHTPQATAALAKALTTSRNDVLFRAAHLYAENGQDAKASELANELEGKFEAMQQSWGKLIRGEVELRKGKARDAVQLFSEAQKLADHWLTRFELGRAYLTAKAYTQADSEFDACLKRRGEASDIFVDEEQTYRYVSPLYYYLGLAREGLGSPGATESFRTFLNLGAQDSQGPLVEDARRRLAAAK